MEKIEEKEYKRDKFVKSIIFSSLVGIYIFLIADMFFKIFTFNAYSVYNDTLLFSVFFGLVIYSLLLGILKKSSRATIVICILVFLLSIVNQIKITFTGEPIYFSDIKFIGETGNLFGLVTKDVSFQSIKNILIGFIIYFVLLAIIIFFNFKYNLEIKSPKIRIIIVLVDILILCLLFFPSNYTKNVCLKIFLNTDGYEEFKSHTTSINYYMRYNLINGMYGTYLNNIFVEPEGYNEKDLNDILNSSNVQKSNIKFGKPNIIVLFSESFWDVEQLDEIEFDKNITENFNNLKQEGNLINLVSPTYGGASENVAFELLTSGSMNYFPRGYIPIMSLYNRKNSENIPSLVKVLNNNGYSSKIVFGKDYYNSKKAYQKMGFEEYVQLTDNEKYENITDKYCTDVIIRDLENKDSTKPILYVLETIESHMPYNKEKYSNYDISITKSNLSNEMNETLLAYSQGIYNSDRELKRLYEYIKNYEEPTILIFLGDHLPYLYTEDNKNVIDTLEYFNTDDELLNDYRKYNTQALILSNYDISDMNINNYSGLDLLLNNIINQLDIKNEKYYEWINTTKDILAASNKKISLDEDGNIYSTNKINGKMKEIYTLKELMQYKFFIKNN